MVMMCPAVLEEYQQWNSPVSIKIMYTGIYVNNKETLMLMEITLKINVLYNLLIVNNKPAGVAVFSANIVKPPPPEIFYVSNLI